MTQAGRFTNSILMLSLHGYVAADPELGKPDTGGQVVYVLELAKRFSGRGCGSGDASFRGSKLTR